ncbi:hypothetical protein PAMC26510_10015 [Caballeronia sordidicola]|uniref:Uncharacterized protein n=1 Tax=Caballeronia sordidicola TaxID=196367 RepID=A0A242MZ66_CABSO|nr:hypothetical protein PAMC26510_10015 [Caballeronia sordidicola]
MARSAEQTEKPSLAVHPTGRERGLRIVWSTSRATRGPQAAGGIEPCPRP